MDAIIQPHPLAGTLSAIPSKSEAHRVLVCAALADGPTRIACRATSEDIEATIACLEALGARIERAEGVFTVHPIDAGSQPRGAVLNCGESGSTLRFLLPVAAALGTSTFTGAGRLAERPLEPLVDALRAHGAAVDADGGLPLTVSGPLQGGVVSLPGNVSSQFITGLMLAAPLLAQPLEIRVAEPVESKPYIALTLQTLKTFGVDSAIVHEEGATCYKIHPGAPYRSPGSVAVGGDWSNAAFWLAAGALSHAGVRVEGLDPRSKQADQAVLGALALFGAQVSRTRASAAAHALELRGARIDVSSCPDLVPAIAPLAALAPGSTLISGAHRLKFKESDRLASISSALAALGAQVRVDDDSLAFEGIERFSGGTVDAANDHRIAMMAAIAAAYATGPVTIRGASCVAKSYPGFFDDFAALGGRTAWEA